MTVRKPGTVGSRSIGRIVLQPYREEDFAPACDPARWGCQFKNSPAVWMKTMAAGRASPPVSSRRNEERAFQAHRESLGRSLCRYRNAGRRTLGSAKTRCRCRTERITCSRTNSTHRAARLVQQEGQNPR